MDISSIATIIISILSSSITTLLLSSIILEPMKDKKRFIFDEKQRVYESIITFAQIVLYPKEARYALGVARYNIQELSDEEKELLNKLKDKKKIIVVNKIDLEGKLDKSLLGDYIEISVKENIGIDKIKDRIRKLFNIRTNLRLIYL